MRISERDIAREIQRLEPGQWVQIDRRILEDAAPPAPLVGIFGPVWSPPERVMENIIGSAYEYRFREDPVSGNFIFERLREPLGDDGSRTFVSPDRRKYFKQDARGNYILNE